VALDRQQVVDEALRLLDGEGLDALSLRTLAGRLGVQAPTLYWHIGSKAELLDALADAIMDEAILAVPVSGPTTTWADWLLTALGRAPRRDAPPPRRRPDRVRRAAVAATR
jgi:TetR/AcrR family tetracycline transcriptional repressor